MASSRPTAFSTLFTTGVHAEGWVTAEWGISETNRKVRFYRLTAAGRKQLEAALSDYDRVNTAIQAVLRTA